MAQLYVISGPSGVGKGTVVRRVLEVRPEIVFSVSCTTRGPRPGEIDGRDYRFVTEGEFDRLIEDGAFLEWAEVYGHRSGTLARPIAEAVEAGLSVLLEIDIRGAARVRETVPGAVLIFLRPPSLPELERRLRSRGTEDEDALARRLARALDEMDQSGWFDHVVANDDVERAAAEVASIIDSGSAA